MEHNMDANIKQTAGMAIVHKNIEQLQCALRDVVNRLQDKTAPVLCPEEVTSSATAGALKEPPTTRSPLVTELLDLTADMRRSLASLNRIIDRLDI